MRGKLPPRRIRAALYFSSNGFAPSKLNEPRFRRVVAAPSPRNGRPNAGDHARDARRRGTVDKLRRRRHRGRRAKKPSAMMRVIVGGRRKVGKAKVHQAVIIRRLQQQLPGRQASCWLCGAVGMDGPDRPSCGAMNRDAPFHAFPAYEQRHNILQRGISA